MGDYRTIFFLVAIMTTVALVIGGVAIGALYDTAFEQRRTDLMQTAQSQARLMEAVARFDRANSQGYTGGAFLATISQIEDAHGRYEGFGETGEFTLARRDGDEIVYILRHGHDELDTPRPVPFDASFAEPMRRALSGLSGTVISVDSRGVTVLAAYEPVAIMDFGIVAEIDLAEIRAPFLRAGGIVFVIGLAIIAAGAALFFRVSNPMLRRIQESENRLSRSVLDAPIPIMMHTEDGEVLMISKKWTELSGYSHADIPNILDWTEKACGTDREHMRDLFGGLYEIEEPFEHEAHVTTVSGDLRIWHFSTAPLGRLPDGRHFVISMATDITERKAAEEALRESEERFRNIAEAASDWFWEMGPDLRFVYHSQRYFEITGFRPEDKIGTTRTRYVNPSNLERDSEKWDAHYADLAAHRPFKNFEYVFMVKDGSILHARISAKPLFDEGGVFQGYRGTGTDITESKRADEALLASERALQEHIADLEEAQRRLEMQGESLTRLADDLLIARDEARAADRTKSEFLAAMSHELRTPMNAVLGFSEIMKDETLGPIGNTRYREYAGDIHDSGQHLLGLINDILDLSKIESGTDELNEDTIEIPNIIHSALKLVEQRAERSAIKLQIEIADQLPALRADERKLKQILVNLLSNAVKFSNSGGEVALWVWCRMGSGHVFQIIDTGIGIAPEDIPKALSRFGQIDADLNRHYEGTGLGLPLTKALIELHGGTLDLQSHVGIGTTITVRFPAERIVELPRNIESMDIAARKVV